jgi:hypothetical protein
MSEHAEQLFVNPSRLFEDGARAKQMRREHIASIFAPPPEPEAADVLDALVDTVAERIIQRLEQAEPEPSSADAAGSGGFDGGARQIPPPPISHDRTILALLRTRGADVGLHL